MLNMAGEYQFIINVARQALRTEAADTHPLDQKTSQGLPLTER